MNRRSFFSKLAVAAAGFTILPPATTYERIWKPTQKIITFPKGKWIVNPEWETARYAMEFIWHDQPPDFVAELPRFNSIGGFLYEVKPYIKA